MQFWLQQWALYRSPTTPSDPLHDGTHGINLNKIRILDRLEVPVPEEVIELVAMAAESKESAFCLSADIAQAHRCVLIRRADWARLSCRSSAESRTLWLNCVGTFGVSSAAYWWTRLFGCVGRWVLRILGRRWSMQLAYVDDLHLLCIGPDKFVTMWMSILAYEVMGIPFSYRKFKGGLSVDYVGYHLEYDRHVASISTKRAEWILQWIDTLEQNGWMVQGPGIHRIHWQTILCSKGGDVVEAIHGASLCLVLCSRARHGDAGARTGVCHFEIPQGTTSETWALGQRNSSLVFA